jgi:predicted TIM-barrel fold metal-dependent hydrolase
MASSAGELLEAVGLVGGRAVAFLLAEPAGHREANDAVLASAEAWGDRLVAFCRLNPLDDPVAEPERCVAAGRGE